MRAEDYIDQACEQLGGISDYALAKKLGRGPSWISRIRNDRRATFDNLAAAKIAQILRIKPIAIIADMQIQRTPEDAEFWEDLKQSEGLPRRDRSDDEKEVNKEVRREQQPTLPLWKSTTPNDHRAVPLR